MKSSLIYKNTPYLIAEIGGNHEGDFEYALELLNLAIESGSDCVKFQLYKAESLVNQQISPDRYHTRQGRPVRERHAPAGRRLAVAAAAPWPAL